MVKALCDLCIAVREVIYTTVKEVFDFFVGNDELHFSFCVLNEISTKNTHTMKNESMLCMYIV